MKFLQLGGRVWGESLTIMRVSNLGEQLWASSIVGIRVLQFCVKALQLGEKYVARFLYTVY